MSTQCIMLRLSCALFGLLFYFLNISHFLGMCLFEKTMVLAVTENRVPPSIEAVFVFFPSGIILLFIK